MTSPASPIVIAVDGPAASGKGTIARGMQAHLPDVLIDIRARDERDRGREAAPLLQAEDADLLDTSEMDVDEAIAAAIALVEARVSAR